MGGSTRRGYFHLDERCFFASFGKGSWECFPSPVHFLPPIKIKERSLKSSSTKYQLSSFSIMRNLVFAFRKKRWCYLFYIIKWRLDLDDASYWIVMQHHVRPPSVRAALFCLMSKSFKFCVFFLPMHRYFMKKQQYQEPIWSYHT